MRQQVKATLELQFLQFIYFQWIIKATVPSLNTLSDDKTQETGTQAGRLSARVHPLTVAT